MPCNCHSHLLILFTCAGMQIFMTLNTELVQDGGSVDNLSQNQHALLHMHYQWAHIGFAKIQ